MMNRLTKINFPLSILIVIFFIIPNNSSNNFNGLPLSSHAETLVLLLLLPLFIFFEKFKKFKKSILVFLVFLIFFKLVSNFFIPNSGVIHKFQRGDSNPENLKTSYIKTFDKVIKTEVSIAIKKEYQGKGIASQILKYLLKNNFFLKKPHAKINKKNISSIYAFKNAGFQSIEYF